MGSLIEELQRREAAARQEVDGGQGGSLRAARPRHCPAFPGVEELRHDDPVPADERLGPLQQSDRAWFPGGGRC